MLKDLEDCLNEEKSQKSGTSKKSQKIGEGIIGIEKFDQLNTSHKNLDFSREFTKNESLPIATYYNNNKNQKTKSLNLNLQSKN